MTRETQQRLAIALGMTLKDGTAIKVDGGKCPSLTKILDFMRDHFEASFRRINKDRRSDNYDDFGGTARHDVCWGDIPAEAMAILHEKCGVECLTGDEVMDELMCCL
jgi:hypothetical protein